MSPCTFHFVLEKKKKWSVNRSDSPTTNVATFVTFVNSLCVCSNWTFFKLLLGRRRKCFLTTLYFVLHFPKDSDCFTVRKNNQYPNVYDRTVTLRVVRLFVFFFSFLFFFDNTWHTQSLIIPDWGKLKADNLVEEIKEKMNHLNVMFAFPWQVTLFAVSLCCLLSNLPWNNHNR